MKNSIVLLILTAIILSCRGETLPKPKPYLKLQYPFPTYKKVESNCPYNFEISSFAKIKFKNNCWVSIEYPQLKAIIHITYRSINNNLDEILREVERLTYEHTIKADNIVIGPSYEDYQKKVFGKLYNVEGNVASNLQFRVTDSVNHILAGALYFYVKPNYDSIVPAIKYIEKDLVHLVETVEWKKKEM